MLWLWVSIALATTLLVPDVYPTIGDAMEAAGDGDTIELAVDDYSDEIVYLYTPKNVTIKSASGAAVTTGPYVVDLGSTSELVLEDLTLPCERNATTVYLAYGSLTLDGVRASDCSGGRLFSLEDANLTIRDSTFSQLDGDEGVVARINNGGSVLIEGSTFESIDASGNGAVLLMNSAGTDSLEVTTSTFEAIESVDGGLLYANGAGLVRLVDLEVTEARAEQGAVIWGEDLGEMYIEGVRVSKSRAEEAMFYLSGDMTSLTVDDVQLEGNDGTVTTAGFWVEHATEASFSRVWSCGNEAIRGASVIHMDGGSLDVSGLVSANDIASEVMALDGQTTLTLSNGTFLGLPSDVLVFGDARGHVTNSLFMEVAGTVLSISEVSEGGAGSYNAWYDVGSLTDGDFDLTTDGLDEVDPELSAYDSSMSCDELQLWLAEGSPLRDAGDPDVLDPDGSVSDIGAFGGPSSLLEDADEDGFYQDLDCDDADPDSYPDADEVPYDGVDQDCDGEDVTDVDGDGYDGLEGGGTDCDDTDADVHPDAEDAWYDGIDSDCDGADDYDQDGDGFDAETSGGDDCDDEDADVNPDAADEDADGIDQDCNGTDGPAADTDTDEGAGGGCRHGGASSLWLALLALFATRRRVTS